MILRTLENGLAVRNISSFSCFLVRYQVTLSRKLPSDFRQHNHKHLNHSWALPESPPERTNSSLVELVLLLYCVGRCRAEIDTATRAWNLLENARNSTSNRGNNWITNMCEATKRTKEGEARAPPSPECQKVKQRWTTREISHSVRYVLLGGTRWYKLGRPKLRSHIPGDVSSW